MKQRSVLFASFVLAALIAAPAAHAQATRTWVSGVGDDANPCSRTAPCKTFAGAISKTAAGGEISVLDPGGFGAVTITKAITINGDGTLAGILASLTNGIIVNAGVNDRVVLRNLSINGAGNGINGIRFLAGKSLLVDNVTISGFTTRCIDVSLAASADMFIKNTTMTNCATGIRVNTTAGFALATLDNVHLYGLTNGVEGAANSRIDITNSDISNNSSNGIFTSVASSVINVTNCFVGLNNGSGINASVAGSLIRISNCDIMNNTNGITGGANVSSAGNNRVVGNGSTTTPSATPIPVQ